MMHSESCQKLRNELRTIRAGLEEVVGMLSSDGEGEIREGAALVSERTGMSFMGKIIEQDHLPEDEGLLRRVLDLIVELGYASTIVLQHRLEVSYRQAASIIADLESAQLIEPAYGFRPHKILPAAFEMKELLNEDCEEVGSVK